MRRLMLGSILAAVLVVAPMALAGGWATAGVGPPPPGTDAGDTWNAAITVLQHGQTPLVGVKPTLTIRNDAGKALTFAAKPTGKPGVYLAQVKFPSGGRWTYEVYDGFTEYGGATLHHFAPVTIGGGEPGGSSFPYVPALGGLIFALAAGLGLLLLIRHQKRTEPAPA